MKRIAPVLIVLIVGLIACNEKYQSLDVSKFNAHLEERSDIQTPSELITVYYDYPESEGVPELEITSKDKGQSKFEITLIHDKLQDDSQRALKIVMLASLQNEKWEVQEIRKNWKCWDGRGHTNWGIELCN